MEPVISKCGYRCDLCAAYEVNFENNMDKQDIQRAFEYYYGCVIPLEKIKPCKGCQALKDAPDEDCQVFPCVQQKGIANCGYCEKFGCEKLKSRMDAVEEILAKQDNVPKIDYERFFKPYLSRKTLTKIQKSLKK